MSTLHHNNIQSKKLGLPTSQSGSALIMAIVALMIVAGIGAAVGQLLPGKGVVSSDHLKSAQALYAAESARLTDGDACGDLDVAECEKDGFNYQGWVGGDSWGDAVARHKISGGQNDWEEWEPPHHISNKETKRKQVIDTNEAVHIASTGTDQELEEICVSAPSSLNIGLGNSSEFKSSLIQAIGHIDINFGGQGAIHENLTIIQEPQSTELGIDISMGNASAFKNSKIKSPNDIKLDFGGQSPEIENLLIDLQDDSEINIKLGNRCDISCLVLQVPNSWDEDNLNKEIRNNNNCDFAQGDHYYIVEDNDLPACLDTSNLGTDLEQCPNTGSWEYARD